MKCQISVTDIQSAGYISAARASNTQLFCNFYDSSVYRPSCFYCNHSTSCSYSFYSAPCIYSYKYFYFYCSSVCASLSCKSDVSVFLSLCKYGCFFSYNIFTPFMFTGCWNIWRSFPLLADSTNLMTFFCFSTVSFDINNSFPEMTTFFVFVSMSSFSHICVEYSLTAWT